MENRKNGWKKRGLAWLCALVLTLGLLPPFTLADDEAQDSAAPQEEIVMELDTAAAEQAEKEAAEKEAAEKAAAEQAAKEAAEKEAAEKAAKEAAEKEAAEQAAKEAAEKAAAEQAAKEAAEKAAAEQAAKEAAEKAAAEQAAKEAAEKEAAEKAAAEQAAKEAAEKEAAEKAAAEQAAKEAAEKEAAEKAAKDAAEKAAAEQATKEAAEKEAAEKAAAEQAAAEIKYDAQLTFGKAWKGSLRADQTLILGVKLPRSGETYLVATGEGLTVAISREDDYPQTVKKFTADGTELDAHWNAEAGQTVLTISLTNHRAGEVTLTVMSRGDYQALQEKQQAEEPAQESAEAATELTEASAEETAEPAAVIVEEATESVAAPVEETTEPTAAPAEETTEPTAAPAEETTESTTAPAEEVAEPTAAPAEETTEPTAAPAKESTEPTAAPAEEAADAVTVSAEVERIPAQSTAWQLAPSITRIAQTGRTTVTLAWAVEAPAEAYEVAEYANGAYTAVATVRNETMATLSGVAAGSHKYAIRPLGTVAGKTVYGEYSSRVSVKVESEYVEENESNASSGTAWKKAPKITQIKQVGSKKIQITWKPVAPAEKYAVYEYVDGKYKLKKKVTGVTTVKITGVKNGKHTYVVRPLATSSGKEVYGKYSSKKSITVVDAWKVAPELTAWQTAAGKVNLSWTVAAKADQYQIYEYKSGKYKLLTTVKKKTTATLKKVSAGNHTYVVLPLKKVSGKLQTGEYSSKAKLKVVKGWEIPVTITSVTQQEDGRTVVAWKANDAVAERYDVYELVNGSKVYLGSSEEAGALSAVISVTPGTHAFVVRARQTGEGKTVYGQYSLEMSAFVELKTSAVVGEFTCTLVGSGAVRIDAWTGAAASLEIPATVVEGHYQVTQIGAGAFAERRTLTSVTLPQGLSRIESRAFAGTGLTSLALPSSLTYVAEDAFDGSYLNTATAAKGTYAYTWGRAHGLVTEYRALLIGEYSFVRYNRFYNTFYMDNASRNVNDTKIMQTMLSKVVGPKGGAYTVTRKTDLSYEGIRSAIQTTFAGTMDQDVSLFFIATHGNSDGDGELEMPFLGSVYSRDDLYDYFYSNMDVLPFSDLASWLQQYVKGEVIVILESCGAGSAIYAGTAEENSAAARTASGAAGISANDREELQNLGELIAAQGGGSYNPDTFVSDAVSAFRQKDTGVLRPAENSAWRANSTGDLRLPKFYVLAAARHHELSWGYQSSRDESDGQNYFTEWLVKGVGKKGSSPADTSGDNYITLTELFKYIKKYDTYSIDGNYQHVQRYPVNSQYQLFTFP